MIIQGSNNPIILEFDSPIEGITDFSAVLSYKGQSIKQWRLGDVQIEDDSITMPLTQEETLVFPSDRLCLEVKWVDNDNICFAEKIIISVEKRFDKTELKVVN